MKRIAIVGSGAVGCYYGAKLVRAGFDVHFLMRSDYEAVRAAGLLVESREETFRIKDVQTATASGAIGPCDLVVVALKTTANAKLKELVAPLIHTQTAILSLQNGLGSDEQMAALFGADRIFGGLCFVCVNRIAPGHVRCLYPGSILFGEFGRPVSDRLMEIVGMFSKAGVSYETNDNLSALRWRKLVWNVPFNGLAITEGGITTDRILANPLLEKKVRTLMHEVIAAAALQGHSMPDNFIEHQIEGTRRMGAYRPSSLIDYQAGHEVEVESIWGEFVRRSEKLGASVPASRLLYSALIKLTRPPQAVN